MKTKMFMLSTALALLFLACGIPGYARVEGSINANIPFSFTVDNTTLPAGNYVINSPVEWMNPQLLEIRQKDGDVAVLFATDDEAPYTSETKTELVFHRIGDKEFLSEVWMAGSDTGSQLLPSLVEKKMQESGANIQTHRLSCQGNLK